MNLIMASVLLLAMLAFQPTLIYGTKNLASARTNGGSISVSSTSSSNRNIRSFKYGKRHSTESLRTPPLSPLSSSAKLVMSLESGDVLVRAARGAVTDLNPNAGNNDGKRQKNNNKKLNKNLASQEAAATPSSTSSSSSSSPASNSNRRKHLEKKFSAASGSSNQKQQQQQQQHANGNKSNNNKQQRQMLKSQNHQNKRSGGKANRENVEKTQSESEKISATCRYVKSAWSECDPKTNIRTRSLTLKKGEPNCPETRTMQKTCKKTCRYEKGAWSECTNGQMTREDKLKATGGAESSCEPVRSINKKCNPNNGGGANKQSSGGVGGSGGNKKERKNKEKGSRRVVKN
ncbi:uncharacterized protein ACRADG_001486 isoform 1-T4 [Cochliomyia hominivorax]